MSDVTASPETAVPKTSAPRAIAANIITGFLGAGKTTAILNLLAQKTDTAPWAVLVNEFGEIGIDGAILSASGVAVKEVPGGCICCVGGLPMQVALNQLIRDVKPARILIEPTGLAHLSQLIATLTGAHYSQVLDLRATVTLVDARKLADARYTTHEIFNDQLQHADIVLANKFELYDESDHARLHDCLQALPPKSQVLFTQQGRFEVSVLDTPRVAATVHAAHHHHHHQEKLPLPFQLAEGETFLCRENHAADGYSCGWLFAPTLVFSFDALFLLLSGLAVDRLKAVMICDRGIFVFNAESGVLSINELDEVFDSRLEVIHHAALPRDVIEQALLQCVVG